VRRVLIHASETCVLSKADERSLRLFEYIFGEVQVKGTWKKRYNHSFLYQLLNGPDITKYINGLSPAGHIGMEKSRTGKNVFDTRPEGTRETGEPKWRWEDGVIQDIRAWERGIGRCGCE
jgi:hypothetical protein